MALSFHNPQLSIATSVNLSFLNTPFLGGITPVEEKELPKDLATEPITGYRAWKLLIPDGNMNTPQALEKMADAWDAGKNPFRALLQPSLAGLGYASPWSVKQEATCIQGHKHEAPHNGCTCGIWAMRNEDELAEVLVDYSPQFYGQILVWGKVVEHAKGWRAQYARIQSITAINVPEKTRNQLAEVYGITITPGEMPAQVAAIQERKRKEHQERLNKQYERYYGLLSNEVSGQGYAKQEKRLWSWPLGKPGSLPDPEEDEDES